MRSLEKHIEKIIRKVAFEAVGQDEEKEEMEKKEKKEIENDVDNDRAIAIDDIVGDKKEKALAAITRRSIVITAENLETYVGKARFTQVLLSNNHKLCVSNKQFGTSARTGYCRDCT